MAQPHVRSEAPICPRHQHCTRNLYAIGPCFTGASEASGSGTRVLSEVPYPRGSVDTQSLPGRLPLGPRRNMLVFQVFLDQLEVGSVVGHQRCSRFPARGRQEEIVDQRLRKTPEFSSFIPRHHGNRGPSLVPGRMARRYHAPCSGQGSQQVLSNLSDFRWSTRSDNQFVKDNRTEVGVRREIREIALEFLRTFLTSERFHKGVRVQYVLFHGSTSPSNTFSTPPLPATRRTPAINSSRRSRAESA